MGALGTPSGRAAGGRPQVWIRGVIGILIVAGVFLSVSALRTDRQGTQEPEGEIAFISKQDDTTDLFLMNADGTGLVQLTQNPMDDLPPAWSPDGSTIALAQGSVFEYDIFVIDPDDGEPRRLTDIEGMETSPTWSPDGSRIAFAADQGGDEAPFNDDIFVTGADGSAVERLTRGEGDEIQPAWAPDGDRILFVSSDPCPPEVEDCEQTEEGEAYLFLLQLDTGTAERLTHRGNVSGPAWSSDGTRIAFAWDSEIWTMNADGSDATLIAPANGFRNVGPSWSPDGGWIAYVSDRDGPPGNEEIYVVSADGEETTRLTDSSAPDRDPAWRPSAGS